MIRLVKTSTAILPKRDVWITDKLMRRWSTPLATREIQTSKQKQKNYKPIRKVKIKLSDNPKSWQEYGETGCLTHCPWECKIIQHFW